MLLIDVNVLVYAHREESPNHAQYKYWLEEVLNGDETFGMADLVLSGFVRVVTHPRVFKPPTPLASVLADLDRLFDAPAVALIGEGPGHRTHLRRMIESGRATGNLAHDGHIAALLLEHGVREFWTTDKDFSRFPGIAVRNPLTGGEVHETRVRYNVPRAVPSRLRTVRGSRK
jgi:toxin-antitoxin system PIN domain toxin